MPRRNDRADQAGPMEFSDDLTAYVPPPPEIGRRTRLETREERIKRLDAEFGRRRERQDRRSDERVARAIADWSVCCIPGCGAELRLYGRRIGKDESATTRERLPVCLRHQAIIADMHDPLTMGLEFKKARERLARQRVAVMEAENEGWVLDDESNGATEGQIYFVRLNGLVKVGWASKLRSRLKAYGANVEVLCHYPASRDDETLLHRQLRPYLAQGREWYQDCKLINDVVAESIKRHGEPTIFPRWTKPKPDVICKTSGPLR